jgi:hypothetical protein
VPTSVTIDTAPRDSAELAKCGRFNLRGLATALGVMNNEKERAEFMALTNEGMVAAILPMLADYDKAKSGGAKAATNKPAAAPVRTPVTSQTPSSAPDSKPAAAGSPVGVVELVRALEALKLTSSEVAQATQARFDTLEGTIEDLRVTLKGTNRILLTSMALNLFLAEEVLKSDRAVVIKTAHDDVPALIATLSELDPGISAEEEEGAGDEEAEEGKE